jgi:hypothetical protein
MTVTREQIASALLAVVDTSYQWASPPTRRLKLWSDVPAELRPAAFLVEHGETRASQSLTLTKRSAEYKLFIYTNSKSDDQGASGGSQLNAILDALDVALTPVGKGLLDGRFTLGDRVLQCQISGSVILDPGDLDGDGIAIVPIRVTIP